MDDTIRTAEFRFADRPIVVAALHAGHAMRSEVSAHFALPVAAKLREEDPFTDTWTRLVDSRIVGLRSRFEVDLNRPRELAVYRNSEDAWGLGLWRDGTCPEEIRERSLELYDEFYSELEAHLSALVQRFGRVVVLDLHSYNHRRTGPHAPPASYRENPEINVGTGTLARARWSNVVDRFVGELRAAEFLGRSLDVRENVKFRGGEFSAWIHTRFPDSVCCLAVEVKKMFMDEWTGEPYPEMVENIETAFASTLPGLIEEIQAVGAAPEPA